MHSGRKVNNGYGQRQGHLHCGHVASIYICLIREIERTFIQVIKLKCV